MTVNSNDIPDLSGELVVDLGTINVQKRQVCNNNNPNNKIGEATNTRKKGSENEEKNYLSHEEVADSLIETFAPIREKELDPINKETNEIISNQVLSPRKNIHKQKSYLVWIIPHTT